MDTYFRHVRINYNIFGFGVHDQASLFGEKNFKIVITQLRNTDEVVFQVIDEGNFLYGKITICYVSITFDFCFHVVSEGNILIGLYRFEVT